MNENVHRGVATMSEAILAMLTVAIGEAIQSVIERGYGGWVLITPSLIIHVVDLHPRSEAAVVGRRIAAVNNFPDSANWRLTMDDGSVVDLQGVLTVKRGHTPIEGTPVLADTRAGRKDN